MRFADMDKLLLNGFSEIALSALLAALVAVVAFVVQASFKLDADRRDRLRFAEGILLDVRKSRAAYARSRDS